VSKENVELVRSLHPAPGTDLARVYRDEGSWAAASAMLAAAFTQDFKCVAHGYLEAEGESFDGVAGLRYLWLEWLTPWDSYRTEVEDVIDLGDNVLVLVRDFGRRAGDTREVADNAAAVWTIRDGKVARIAFWADRVTALNALGLEE
jgi:ketosteroid isomerase-like protein